MRFVTLPETRFATLQETPFAVFPKTRPAIFAMRFLAVALLILAAATSSFSQSDRGTIAGTVQDSSGAAVQGATVTATDSATNTVYTATSGPTGGYRLYDLRVSVYRVSAVAAGFKTEEKTGVVVQINTTSSLDFTLQPGDVKETLTVVADAPGDRKSTRLNSSH